MRHFHRSCVAGLGFVLIGWLIQRSGVARVQAEGAGSPGPIRLYVGTYTGEKSKGIQKVDLDAASGKLSEPVLAGESNSPSYLALSADQRFLFAVNEMANVDGNGAGGVSSFAVDPSSGKLTAINQQPSGGSGPCHLSLDASGSHLLVANYNSGTIEVLPVDREGKLGAATATIQHAEGGNTDKSHQPHAHWIGVDPSGRFVLACDLGLDRIFVYRYDSTAGTLAAADPPAAIVRQGSGPRHLVFSRDGRFAYVICELNSTVIAFAWDAEHGTLKQTQSLSSLPSGEQKTASAEIRLHPSGKFLYASNRGGNTIAVFAVDPQSGALALSGHADCGGRTPRGMAVDASGAWLIVANQESDNLASFKIDPKSGSLTPAGKIAVGAPVDVLVVPSGPR